MTKADLIAAIAAKEGLTEKEAYAIVSMIFDGFANTLKKGERIDIRGFGNFSVRKYKSYMGRNPKTGAETQVGSKRLPYFKVGKELRERVNRV